MGSTVELKTTTRVEQHAPTTPPLTGVEGGAVGIPKDTLVGLNSLQDHHLASYAEPPQLGHGPFVH
jgi:hypothetical protein